MTVGRAWCAGAITLAVAALIDVSIDAHKPVTSRYTFSEDVYPIVSQRCGGCHAPDGVAPMSLLTYDDARPWAESIREEIVSGHMPPWFADVGFSDLKDPPKLSPREIDVLLTWATGGTPRGPAKPPPASANTAKSGWQRGRPDLEFSLPTEFTMAAETSEETRDFVVRASNDRDRWIGAADLLPANPSIVHDAAIYTRRPDGQMTVIATWMPGLSQPIASAAPAGPSDIGFVWRAGEPLGVRIHYKKNWKHEGRPASDRSKVGLYVLKRASRDVRSVLLPSSGLTVEADLLPVAVRSADAPSGVDVRIHAQSPDGSRIPIVGFATRLGWDQRYWLARPPRLVKGTRLTVSTSGHSGTATVPIFLDYVVP
jgi:hypothetical protein